jgi:pyruvate dehydrogenase E1 component alpha subunit
MDRPVEVVEACKGHDPLPRYHDRLLSLGTAEERLSTIEREVAAAVDAATEFAKAGREPGEDVLFTDVYADGGSAWRN